MGIKWYDRLSNVEVRKRTESAKLEKMLKEKNSDGYHVTTTGDCRIPNRALNWNLTSMNRKSGRPRKKLAGHYPKRFKGHGIEMGRRE